MLEFLGKIWSGLTGAGKQKDVTRKPVASSVPSGRADTPAKKAGEKSGGKSGEKSGEKAGKKVVPVDGAASMSGRGRRRNYAGRLPVCAGCMNIGGCAGFFPGCGCYGSSHDTVKVSAGSWHGQRNFSRGSSLASPEFAAWCAFMGYPVAERYWAEYEDVWNYYEEALHEYGSEYEFFDEYTDACHDEYAFDEYADACHDEYAFDEYADARHNEHVFDEYADDGCNEYGCDEHDYEDYDACDRDGYDDYGTDEQAYDNDYSYDSGYDDDC